MMMPKNTAPRKSRIDLIQELESLKSRLELMETSQIDCLRAVENMRESEQKYRILLDESSDPIFSINHDGQYLYVNLAFADGVGKNIESILDRKIWDVFSPEEAEKRYAVVKWVFANKVTKVFEVRVPRQEGDRFYITTVKPTFDHQGNVFSVICISKEITDRKRIEEELIHLNTHDTLTGLYNRNYYEVELKRLQNSRQFPISIVIADMDNLKAVNDRLGHLAGDKLIQKVAQCMRASFRAEDIVARIGGDEFGVLLPMTEAHVAESCIIRLREQLDVEKNPLLHISLGVATGNEGADLQEVMRQADNSMYHEKFARKNVKVDV